MNKGNIIHIFVINLYGDKWLLDILWHKKILSLCCTPETNVIYGDSAVIKYSDDTKSKQEIYFGNYYTLITKSQ